MNATQKNLLVLTRIEERMEQALCRDHYEGHPALAAYDLQRSERYHADRLVELGFLKRTKTTAPWYGPVPITLYWRDETCRANPFPWRGMENTRMLEKLVDGAAMDLSGCTRSAEGEYLLGQVDVEDLALARSDYDVLRLAERDTLFIEGNDYCNAVTEAWIWSIGVHRETGQVWASHQANKYRNPAFICIWLR